VTPRTGVPTGALTLEMLIGLALLVGFRIAGTPALSVFFYLATLGVLSLLVMYIFTNVAAAHHLARKSAREVVLPIVGTGVAGFVLYHTCGRCRTSHTAISRTASLPGWRSASSSARPFRGSWPGCRPGSQQAQSASPRHRCCARIGP